MAGKSPEEWVDRDVLVEIFTGAVDYQVVARLDGINDWGIVLNGAELGGGEAVFYPWRLVVAMRLAREEDLGPPPS